MIEKMTKYTILLLSGEKEDFLLKVQELGLLDIRRSAKPVDSYSEAILQDIRRCQQAVSALEKIDFSGDEDYEAVESRAAAKVAEHSDADIIQQVADGRSALASIDLRRKALERECDQLQPWGRFRAEDISRLAADGVRLHFYNVAKKRFSPEWAERWPLEVISQSEDQVWFVVAGESDIPCPELPCPAYDYQGAQDRLKALDEESLEARSSLLALRSCLPAEQQRLAVHFDDMQRYLAAAGAQTAAEDHITILTGFAPTADDSRMAEALDGMGVYYISEKAVREDNPPIRLKNNWFARLFETLTGMYGMPVYDEFDPTPILAPFFLLFWAFCMGDGGYGLLLIGISFLLRKVNIMGLRAHRKLVATLGVGTFVIGILLGTFFGINLAEASWFPQALKPYLITGKLDVAGSSYDLQMVVAIAIGVLHICLAMVIKAIGFTRRFGIAKAISAWGWVILIIGGLTIAAGALLSVWDATVTRWAVIAVGVIALLSIFLFNTPGRNPLINFGAGLWDTYNMATGILGDVLSYIRLYALGLAGGMLGGAFNELGMMIVGDQPMFLLWIPCILVLVFGHALNLAMSCLGAFVHPLRLTFVEYFKNSGYEGKGIAFNPLRKESATVNK